MKDEFAGQRLPDLPDAGYATRRERALTDEIMFFVRGCERNRRLLLTIVWEGREKFRAIGRKAWSHLRVDTDLCDSVYQSLCMTACPDLVVLKRGKPLIDEGVARGRAWQQLQALDAYEALTMAQRIHQSDQLYQQLTSDAMKRLHRRH